jgi:hypothetical protein
VNRIGHTASLADPHANASPVVTDDGDDTESKSAAALHDIRNPRDVYDVFI